MFSGKNKSQKVTEVVEDDQNSLDIVRSSNKLPAAPGPSDLQAGELMKGQGKPFTDEQTMRLDYDKNGNLDGFVWKRSVKRKKDHLLRIIKILAIVIVFGVTAFLALSLYGSSRRDNETRDLLRDLPKQITAVFKKEDGDNNDQRIDATLEAVQDMTEKEPAQKELEDMRKQLESLRASGSTRNQELLEAQSEVSRRLDKIYHEELMNLAERVKGGDFSARSDFMEKKMEYLPFLSVSTINEINNMTAEFDSLDNISARKEIYAIQNLTSRSVVEEKVSLIEQFLKDYPATVSKEEILKAAATARTLASIESFRVSLSFVGTFVQPTKHRVVVETGGKQVDFGWSKKDRASSGVDVKNVAWTPGQPISVKIEIPGRFGYLSDNSVVKEIRDDSALSIRLLGTIITNWENSRFDNLFEDSNDVRALFSIEGFAESDWELIDKYFYPGEYWKEQ